MGGGHCLVYSVALLYVCANPFSYEEKKKKKKKKKELKNKKKKKEKKKITSREKHYLCVHH